MLVFLALSLASGLAAARSRVSVLEFSGERGQQLRWRVAREIKKAGHSVLGYKAPPPGSSSERFLRFANRRGIDVMVSGTSYEGEDGWSLSLTLHGPDGSEVGSPLSYRAETLGELVQVIKSSGRDDFRDALELPLGGGIQRVETAPEPPKKKKRRRRRKPLPEPEPELEPDPDPTLINLDEPSPSSEASSEVWNADDSPYGVEGEDETPESQPKKKNRLAFLQSPTLVSSDGEESGSGAGDDSSAVDDGGEEEASEGDDPFFRLGVGAGLVRRSLSYVDDLYRRLRTPNTTAWVYRFEAGLFPFAKPLRDRVELIASYETVFSGTVRDDAVQSTFDLNHSELQGGVRLRQPLGAHELALELAFGRLRSGLADPNGLSRVPEFTYTAFRSSLELGLSFGALRLFGSGGLYVPSGFGQAAQAEWFPRLEGSGVQGAAGMDYAVSDGVALRLSGTARRFVMEMNATPDDAREGVAEVAGGAVDLYLSGYMTLSVSL